MIKVIAIFVAGIIVFSLPVICQADVYRWTDDQGRTHFTDDLNKVPPQFRAEAAGSKQKDIPPTPPIKKDTETPYEDIFPRTKKAEQSKGVQDIKPKSDQGIDAGPPGIGYSGQQINSKHVRILNGGVKYIPELGGVGYTYTLLNQTKEPVWITLRIGEEGLTGEGLFGYDEPIIAGGGGKTGILCTDNIKRNIEPGQSVILTCPVTETDLSSTYDYPVRIEIYDSGERIGSEPLETHRFKIDLNRHDVEDIKSLISQAKEKGSEEHTHHDAIQSDWVEITSSAFRILKSGPIQKYTIGLSLKSLTSRDIWAQVSFQDSEDNEICSSTDKIPFGGKESFGCRQSGTIPLDAEFLVNITIYRNERYAKSGKHPEETLQTVLRTRGK